MDSRVRREISKEDEEKPKRCYYNDKGEVNCLNILSNNDDQALSQKFWQKN